MITICFNENNQNYFKNTKLIADFKKQHPNAKIIYTFNTDDDIDTQLHLAETQFAKYCGDYGFLPSDYNAIMLEKNGNIQRLVGFRPQNTKYKCLVLDEKQHKTYKAAPSYVKTCIARYNSRQSNIAKITTF